MVPAQARVDDGELPGVGQLHGRPVDEREFAVLQGPGNDRAELVAAAVARVEFRVEQHPLRLAGLLCPVQRDFRGPQQFRGTALDGRADDDARAGAHADPVPAEVDRLGEVLERTFDQLDHRGRGQVAAQQDGEAVARKSRHESVVPAVEHRGQLVRHTLQHLVSDAEAEPVVDHLEAVDVQVHQRDLVAGAGAERGFELGGERGLVRQPGQRVVHVLVQQAFLQQVELVGVGHHQHGIARAGPVAGQPDQRGVGPELAVRRVFEQDAFAEALQVGAEQLLQPALEPGDVVAGGAEFGQVPAAQLIRPAVEQPAERVVGLHDDAVRVGEGDTQRGGGIERGEAQQRRVVPGIRQIDGVMSDLEQEPLEVLRGKRYSFGVGQCRGPAARDIDQPWRGTRLRHTPPLHAWDKASSDSVSGIMGPH